MAAPIPPVKVYYGKPMLPDVSRVLACLYEKDVQFTLIDMNEGKKMNRDLIQFQASRAPISGYEDESTKLFESRAICRHIVDKYADRGNKYLLGRDLLERASIEQWLKSEEHSFDPPSWTLVFHLAFDVVDRALITQSERMLSKVLDVYEQRLSESKYLGGEEFSLADLSHLPNSHYLVRSREWGHLFKSRKNVRNWWENISSRPSWQEVVKILKEHGLLESKTTSNHLKLHPPDDILGQIQEKVIEQTRPEGFIDKKEHPTAQSSNQPATTEDQKQEKPQPELQANSVGQSETQQSPIGAQSPTKPPAPVSSSIQKQDQKAQATREVTEQTSTQQVTPSAPSSQKESRKQSDQEKEPTTKTQSSTELPGSLSSKEQEKPTDHKGITDARSSSLSAQKQQKDSQSMSEEESGTVKVDQKARLDAEPTTEKVLNNAPPSQKQENNGQVKSIKQEATSDVQSSTELASPPGDLSTQQQVQKKDFSNQTVAKEGETGAQNLNQQVSPSAIPSIKGEQDVQLKRQGESAELSIPPKQATVTGAPSTEKQEEGLQQKSQDNSLGQKTPSQGLGDDKISTQGGSVDAKSSQRQAQDAKLTGQAESIDRPIPQKQDNVAGALLNEKKDQSTQQKSQDESSGQKTPTKGLGDAKFPTSDQETATQGAGDAKVSGQGGSSDDAKLTGQAVSQQNTENADSSTQQTSSPILSSQNQEENNQKNLQEKTLDQPKQGPTDVQTSNTEQAQDEKLTGQPSAPSNLSSQSKEENIQQPQKENSSGQTTATQEGPNAPSGQDEENAANKTVAEDQSVGQQETIDDKSSKAQKTTESTSTTDTTGQPFVPSSQSKEENIQQPPKDNSSSQTTATQGSSDAQSPPQQGPNATSNKKQENATNKADSAGQSTESTSQTDSTGGSNNQSGSSQSTQTNQ